MMGSILSADDADNTKSKSLYGPALLPSSAICEICGQSVDLLEIRILSVDNKGAALFY
jgi:hypothetical protein